MNTPQPTRPRRKRLRRWLDHHRLHSGLILLLLAAVGVALLWNIPLSMPGAAADMHLTSQSTSEPIPTITTTPSAVEQGFGEDMRTNGIILGAVVLMVIILAGVGSAFIRHPRPR